MRLLKTEKIEPGFVEARVKKDLVRIQIEDVTHFHASEKYVTAYSAGRELLFNVPLKAIAEFYGDRFIFVHRNALVSRERIQREGRGRISEPLVYLRGVGAPLAVSRRCLPAVRAVLRQACEAAAARVEQGE